MRDELCPSESTGEVRRALGQAKVHTALSCFWYQHCSFSLYVNLAMPKMWRHDGHKKGICLKLILFLETVQKLFCERLDVP